MQEVSDLIETQAGARLHYLPPYSPDLNPAEGVFSQIKCIMKQNHKLVQVCSAPRAMIAGMVTHKTALDTFHTVVTYNTHVKNQCCIVKEMIIIHSDIQHITVIHAQTCP